MQLLKKNMELKQYESHWKSNTANSTWINTEINGCRSVGAQSPIYEVVNVRQQNVTLLWDLAVCILYV